jgi:hypothetical protein
MKRLNRNTENRKPRAKAAHNAKHGITECAYCGQKFRAATSGRPGAFCKDKCRVYFWRAGCQSLQTSKK